MIIYRAHALKVIYAFFTIFKAQSNYLGEIMSEKNLKQYWTTNLRYLIILLTIWFLVSYGAGIIWADQLNQVRIGGFKLGFWFAQQGSIYVFVLLIYIYVRLMNRLDRLYDVHD